MLGEDTQQLFTHLDSGALVWGTRTNLLGCPTQVDTWVVSRCETCPKKVSIPDLVREKIMSSAWNSAKTDNCDVHVVEEQSPHFTSDSAQRLIQDIMFCSQDLDIIKQKTNDIEQKLKNMIDVLERI
ncbi:hypothetical protein AB205_0201950 [Aquarana catesbeiana]|uniref:Uncharacterized protein n=1 Tax=Aquarana catesbeiana TaxID=8400 RepID=A0A2G9SFN4_AQUCT|nr:hypothetical protein AB205_0201950 [Aquarana catesbeiana]